MGLFDFSSLLSNSTFKKAAFGKVSQMLKEIGAVAVIVQFPEGSEEPQITPVKSDQVVISKQEYDFLLETYKKATT